MYYSTLIGVPKGGGGAVVEPNEIKRPSRKPRKKRSGRRPGAGAPRGNLNAFKHGRYSRYQQAFIETLMQVPQTRETSPEPAARSSRRVMITIIKRAGLGHKATNGRPRIERSISRCRTSLN